MDITSLRIKFTPLLKNVRKGACKCCLEIVPEVSAIHNLDRIQWTLEENLVEYRIPMTYRIILKKPRIDRESSTNLDKTYHSCVDLMSKCSMTNLDISSVDIKRILSENFVLNKITTDIEQCNVILNNKIHESIVKSAKTASVITLDVKPNSILREPPILQASEMYTQNNESNGTLVAEVTNEDLANHLNDNKVFVVSDNGSVYSDNEAMRSDMKTVRSRNRIVHSIIKAVHTEDLYEYYDDEDNLPAVSNQNIKPRYTTSRRTIYRNRHRQYLRPRLSLSPICSVNTYDDPPAETASYRSILCNSDCQIYKPYLKKICKTVLPKSLPNDYNETNAINGWTYHKESENYSNKRILPVVRIAHFKQVLEKEIFPLKLMLVEIQHKCSSLGLLLPQHYDKNIILYKSFPNFERDRQVTKSCNNQTNRGVYTVVFNE